MNKRKALQKGSDDSKSSASSSSAGLKEDTLFQATEVDRKVFDDLRNPNLSDSTSDDSFNKKQQAFQKKKKTYRTPKSAFSESSSSIASSPSYSTSKATNMDITGLSTPVETKNAKWLKLDNFTIPKKNIKTSKYQSSEDESMSPKGGDKKMLRDVKTKTSVDNPIDMTDIQASPEKETVEVMMSKMQLSSDLKKFVSKDNNDLDEYCQTFSPKLNKCQEHALLYKITRNNLLTSSPVFYIKKRHKIVDFFDHVFGIKALREKKIHGGIDISKVVLTYIKAITMFDKAVKKSDDTFMLFGNKDKNNPLHEKMKFDPLRNRHVTNLLNEKSNKYLNTILLGVYTDLLNLSMGNSPQDGTISDVIVLKPWSMNDVLDQKPFQSNLHYDNTSADLLKLWYHRSKFYDTGLLRYWQTQNYPIRQIVSPLN
mgnify:FL=1